MAGSPQPSDFVTRFKAMERRLAALERSTSLNGASVSGGDLTVKNGGDILLRDATGDVIWKASEDPTVFDADWAENNGLSIPATWTDFYSTRVLAIPQGFKSGLMQVHCAVGDSFSGEGNVSVAPIIRCTRADGTFVVGQGPALNSGNSNISVATSFYLSKLNFDTPDSPWASAQFGVRCIRVGTEASATSGNWHLSGSILFKRGTFDGAQPPA